MSVGVAVQTEEHVCIFALEDRRTEIEERLDVDVGVFTSNFAALVTLGILLPVGMTVELCTERPCEVLCGRAVGDGEVTTESPVVFVMFNLNAVIGFGIRFVLVGQPIELGREIHAAEEGAETELDDITLTSGRTVVGVLVVGGIHFVRAPFLIESDVQSDTEALHSDTGGEHAEIFAVVEGEEVGHRTTTESQGTVLVGGFNVDQLAAVHLVDGVHVATDGSSSGFVADHVIGIAMENVQAALCRSCSGLFCGCRFLVNGHRLRSSLRSGCNGSRFRFRFFLGGFSGSFGGSGFFVLVVVVLSDSCGNGNGGSEGKQLNVHYGFSMRGV